MARVMAGRGNEVRAGTNDIYPRRHPISGGALDPVEVAELMDRTDVRSSKVGKELAGKALENPAVLDVVVDYLGHDDKAKRAAAAETFAEACKKDPRVGLPYLSEVSKALGNEEPQTRWEALMALSYMSTEAPEEVGSALPSIVENLHDPKSMIVRSSAALCLGRLGGTSTERARRVLPLLGDALDRYGKGNELGSILDALSYIAASVDDKMVKGEMAQMVAPFEDHQRASIVKRVKRIQRSL
jgi:hypothetical protein